MAVSYGTLFESGDVGLILAISGFVIGFLFGAITFATNFCTMGAISDLVVSGDGRRFRSWILASALALAGTQALAAAGLLNLEDSIYLQGRMNWFGAILGGLIFGFGMVLAAGCPSRNLTRAGAGDLRSLTVLIVMALFAYIAISGVLAPLRVWLENLTSLAPPSGMTSSVSDLAAFVLGAQDLNALRLIIGFTIAAAATVYCLCDAAFRTSIPHMGAGLGVGLCAIAGWAATAFAIDEFAAQPSRPTSLTFVRSTAETIDVLMRFTALNSVGFGVMLIAGCIVGAFSVAASTGRFRLHGFAGTADTMRNLAGAALMGVGGVVALGCSIGQGVTGVSTMAAASFLAFAAMSMGAVAGIKFLENRV